MSRGRGIAYGLLVTFLWSTSYVLIKWGVEELPPMTFAAYRYLLAPAILIPPSLR